MGTPGANLSEVYPLVPFLPVAGQGVYLRDAAGRRVLDLYGGHAVAALGYAHPRLTEAIGPARQQHCTTRATSWPCACATKRPSGWPHSRQRR